MRDVIVVNLHAASVKNRAECLLGDIRALGTGAAIVASGSVAECRNALDDLMNESEIERIFVVGGDGTMRGLFPWLVAQSHGSSPAVCAVGGGQFCYLTRWCGFWTSDPVRNLRRVFANDTVVRIERWRPLKIYRDDGLVEYASIIGDGLVSQCVQWYDEAGKGTFTAVVSMIVCGIGEVVFGPFLARRRLHHIEHRVWFNGERVAKRHAGVLVGAVDRILPGCSPFQGIPKPDECYALMTSASLGAIALGVFGIWIGVTPPWMRKSTRNAPAQTVEFTTNESVTLDGDLVRLSDPVKFHVSRGETIHVLRVT